MSLEYEDELKALQLSIDLVTSKLKVIDTLPQEQIDALRKLVSNISMLPNRYKTGSVTPYYKEKYAQIVKEQIADPILADPEHHSIFVSSLKMGKSRGTVQQMLVQGWQHLIECSDTEGKYAKLRSQVEIKLEAGGVLVRWRTPKLAVVERTDVAEFGWQDALEKFMVEAKDGETLDLKFSLDQQELAILKQQLEDISETFVTLHVSEKQLKLQKNIKLAAYMLHGD